jgi:hypothetical protein
MNTAIDPVHIILAILQLIVAGVAFYYSNKSKKAAEKAAEASVNAYKESNILLEMYKEHLNRTDSTNLY